MQQTTAAATAPLAVPIAARFSCTTLSDNARPTVELQADRGDIDA